MNLDPKMQAKLHEELAQRLLESLQREACESCGFKPADPRLLTVVRQFLADNGTTADLANRAPRRALTDNLPEFDPEQPIVKPAKKRTA